MSICIIEKKLLLLFIPGDFFFFGFFFFELSLKKKPYRQEDRHFVFFYFFLFLFFIFFRLFKSLRIIASLLVPPSILSLSDLISIFLFFFFSLFFHFLMTLSLYFFFPPFLFSIWFVAVFQRHNLQLYPFFGFHELLDCFCIAINLRKKVAKRIFLNTLCKNGKKTVDMYWCWTSSFTLPSVPFSVPFFLSAANI